MNQYEVLYAVKDDYKENELFADVGEAPHPWRGWTLESTTVTAYNMSDAQKSFYRYVDAFADGRECVFVKAQFIGKLQYSHQIVVAVKENQNLNGWRIETISVKTDSETSDLNEFWDLALQELKKKYHGAISQGNYVILEKKKPEACLDVEC